MTLENTNYTNPSQYFRIVRSDNNNNLNRETSIEDSPQNSYTLRTIVSGNNNNHSSYNGRSRKYDQETADSLDEISNNDNNLIRVGTGRLNLNNEGSSHNQNHQYNTRSSRALVSSNNNGGGSSHELIPDYGSRLINSPAMSILCLTTMSEINPHLFISGASAVNEYKIRGKGITFIVNVTIDFPNVRIPGVETVAIRVDDSPSAQLYPYFDTIADKIKEVAFALATENSSSQLSPYSSGSGSGAPTKPGKTLVHCMVGASRSATLVIAYLMKHRKMSLLQAYSFLKHIRPVVRPNPGFFKQLICYEYALFGHNTVKMVIAPVSSTPYPYRGGLIPDVYLCD